MNKKQRIISNVLDGYHAYVNHSGGVFQMEWAEDLLNRIIEFKGCDGYQLRVNDKYNVNMSEVLYEFERGHYAWFEIGSFIVHRTWHIGGKLVRIETDYKTNKETV